MTRMTRTTHPNGFTKWQLHIPILNWQARIHHWTTQRESDIHREDRPFISLILRGQLTEHRWTQNSGNTHTLLEWVDGTVQATIGTAAFTVQDHHRRTPGHIYTLPTGHWHSVTGQPGTLTISIRGRQHCTALIAKPQETQPALGQVERAKEHP